jgi:hypothetical protein
MDIRIGIINAPSEVKIDMADDTVVDDVKAAVEAALQNDSGLVWLTDKKGRETGFPADRLAYIEFGIPNDDQRIGFS